MGAWDGFTRGPQLLNFLHNFDDNAASAIPDEDDDDDQVGLYLGDVSGLGGVDLFFAGQDGDDYSYNDDYTDAPAPLPTLGMQGASAVTQPTLRGDSEWQGGDVNRCVISWERSKYSVVTNVI